MEKSPPPFTYARFEEKNILDCMYLELVINTALKVGLILSYDIKGHFILRGPPDSPYHGGEYHGVINVRCGPWIFSDLR
jgi:ubiquitin-conjugating enzyme E2 J2